MKKRRNIEAFSLSFLDCICCGFGAIVLLLVLSKIYDPNNLNVQAESIELSQSLKEQLEEIQNESSFVDQNLREAKLNTVNLLQELEVLNKE